MTDLQSPAGIAQLVVEVRDATQTLRDHFDARFDNVASWVGSFRQKMDRFDQRMDSLEQRFFSLESLVEALDDRIAGGLAVLHRLGDEVGALQTQIDFLTGKVDVLERRIDVMDDRNDEHHQELFRRFSLMDQDLKKFVAVVNDAVLHYAGEMDVVRTRLTATEKKLGLPIASE